MKKIFDVIQERRSIRKYEDKEVPVEKIKRVLHAANWAPSNGNSQPWNFIVLKGEPRKQICAVFSEWAQDYIPKAPYIPAEKKGPMLEYAKDFGGASVHIVVTYETDEDLIKTEEALMAASAAIQNLCLAAYEEGLGTVWIAGEVAYKEATKEIIKLPKNQKIAGIIPIGYPAMSPPVPERQDPDLTQKVTWLGF